MTQEEKELLLEDLCARLPYGVKVWYKYYPTNNKEKIATSIRLADDKLALSNKLNDEGDWYPIEEAKEILIKPYLRPLSSMTKEELKELRDIFNGDIAFYDWGLDILNCDFHAFSYLELCTIIDWLNANHFDYRGLIEKDLALEAPKDMYNIKEK